MTVEVYSTDNKLHQALATQTTLVNRNPFNSLLVESLFIGFDYKEKNTISSDLWKFHKDLNILF